MAEPIALAALVLDGTIGWPSALYARIGHPVGGFARIITACEHHWNTPARSNRQRRLLGVVTVLILLCVTLGGGLCLQIAIERLFGDMAWLIIALLAFPALAQRSLFDHVRPIVSALAKKDLPTARKSVGMIVGRDTDKLDEAGVSRAAIESLAESFCDGIAAPLFWLLLLGLPGIWAYKAINTADSLIGHKEERWRAFGWAAARTDDVLNLVPARLGGAIICIAAGRGWRIMARHAHRHASPNAGWTEAAMAGALGIRLAGPVSYDGIRHSKAWIGDGNSGIAPEDIRRALALYLKSCFMLWLIAGGLAWAL